MYQIKIETIADKSNYLQETVVGALEGFISLDEAINRWDKAYEGIGKFVINHVSGINGTVCYGSKKWLLGSRDVVLDVLAETSDGPQVLRLALNDGHPNFHFSRDIDT